jgi:hypothetical protein
MRIEDVFPDSRAVEKLLVSQVPQDIADSRDFWMWFRSLQGLANRSGDHLYVTPEKPGFREDEWLSYYHERFGIPTEDVGGPDMVLERWADRIKGYILCDDDVPQTMNLAITRAGLEGLLPIVPEQREWMIRHGIPMVDDLTGRFKNDWDSAEWAVENLWPQCNQRLYANLCIHRPHWSSMSHHLCDFTVMNKIFALDLSCARFTRKSLELYHRVLDSAEAPGAQFGWHCTFDQEKEYVAEAAQRGFVTIASTSITNLSVHGGVGDQDASYPVDTPAAADCVAEKGKVYVCYYMSDGDACSMMTSHQGGNWDSEHRGEVPFSWGFLPLTVRLMPGILQYYQETKKPNDNFWGPASGAAYTYSHMLPDEHVEWYLTETRRLLDQTGQNGCNMCNWFLQDWWREVEDDDAVNREREILGKPGLICGLGGSPYAKSYLGDVPKVHSVHIANGGRDNVSDIVKFTRECHTRPLFVFLFAQIGKGVYDTIAEEMPALSEHAEIEVVRVDEFAMLLQNAIDNGLIGETLYNDTDELRETWLKAPGRNRLPISENLAAELARTLDVDADARRKILSEGGWTQLVSSEVEGLAQDRERFLTQFGGRRPVTADEEQDAMFYTLYHVAWGVVRAALEAQGIYANGRVEALERFRETVGDTTDMKLFDSICAAWDSWESGAPAFGTTAEWCRGLVPAARGLTDRLGPDENEEFSGWPPRTI